MHPYAKFHDSTSTSAWYVSVDSNADVDADAEGISIVLPLLCRGELKKKGYGVNVKETTTNSPWSNLYKKIPTREQSTVVMSNHLEPEKLVPLKQKFKISGVNMQSYYYDGSNHYMYVWVIQNFHLNVFEIMRVDCNFTPILSGSLYHKS